MTRKVKGLIAGSAIVAVLGAGTGVAVAAASSDTAVRRDRTAQTVQTRDQERIRLRDGSCTDDGERLQDRIHAQDRLRLHAPTS